MMNCHIFHNKLHESSSICLQFDGVSRLLFLPTSFSLWLANSTIILILGHSKNFFPSRFSSRKKKKKKKKSVAWVCKQSIPTSNRRLSAKLVPTFADRGCHVVSVAVPYGHILDFLDQSRYFFFQVAPQLYSGGWVDPAMALLDFLIISSFFI
jgi:hypothetical protein